MQRGRYGMSPHGLRRPCATNNSSPWRSSTPESGRNWRGSIPSHSRKRKAAGQACSSARKNICYHRCRPADSNLHRGLSPYPVRYHVAVDRMFYSVPFSISTMQSSATDRTCRRGVPEETHERIASTAASVVGTVFHHPEHMPKDHQQYVARWRPFQTMGAAVGLNMPSSTTFCPTPKSNSSLSQLHGYHAACGQAFKDEA